MDHWDKCHPSTVTGFVNVSVSSGPSLPGFVTGKILRFFLSSLWLKTHFLPCFLFFPRGVEGLTTPFLFSFSFRIYLCSFLLFFPFLGVDRGGVGWGWGGVGVEWGGGWQVEGMGGGGGVGWVALISQELSPLYFVFIVCCPVFNVWDTGLRISNCCVVFPYNWLLFGPSRLGLCVGLRMPTSGPTCFVISSNRVYAYKTKRMGPMAKT